MQADESAPAEFPNKLRDRDLRLSSAPADARRRTPRRSVAGCAHRRSCPTRRCPARPTGVSHRAGRPLLSQVSRTSLATQGLHRHRVMHHHLAAFQVRLPDVPVLDRRAAERIIAGDERPAACFPRPTHIHPARFPSRPDRSRTGLPPRCRESGSGPGHARCAPSGRGAVPGMTPAAAHSLRPAHAPPPPAGPPRPWPGTPSRRGRPPSRRNG